jgi:hypothetical protein
MAIQMKNKLGFVDGSIRAPERDDPKFSVWDRCNPTICSWILHSLKPAVLSSILLMDTTVDIWKDLKNLYWQGDLFSITKLQ